MQHLEVSSAVRPI